MTPKEKAKELVEKFKDLVATNYQYDDEPLFECQVESAMITVDEILLQLGSTDYISKLHLKDRNYWAEVREYLDDMKQ